MAVDINVVVLVGRLTRDCELKSTPQGTSVCRFSIAVNRRKRTGDRWEDEVSYFDVVLWGKSADTLKPYLQKGRQVSIEGELRQNRWEQDGKTNSKVEVVANNVQLLETRAHLHPCRADVLTEGTHRRSPTVPHRDRRHSTTTISRFN